MAEWLILLLLVPAIVVPVVLLVGFTGCERAYEVPPLTSGTPVIDSAVGKSGTIITLTWKWSDYPSAPTKFQFERTNPDSTTTPFEILNPPASPYDDTGLAPATSYQYRVRSVYSDGSTTNWSARVTGTTLQFEPTFAEVLTRDSSGWQGYTLVQRIEAVRLFRSGTQVQITVQASSVSDTSIDRVYISQANPTGKPYDSFSDLTAVYDSSTQPFVVPKMNSRPLPVVTYSLDHTQPLLVAVDFSPPPAASGIKYTGPVPATEAVAYYHLGAEAKLNVRSVNYVSTSNIDLITVIAVE
jgi:hypothetical protein